MTLSAAATTVQLEAAKQERTWLVEAEKFFKKKHPWCWEALNAINKPSQESGLLRLLDLGEQREDELLKLYNKEMPSLSLERSQDNRKELVFVPYKNAGSVMRKFMTTFSRNRPNLMGPNPRRNMARNAKVLLQKWWMHVEDTLIRFYPATIASF